MDTPAVVKPKKAKTLDLTETEFSREELRYARAAIATLRSSFRANLAYAQKHFPGPVPGRGG